MALVYDIEGDNLLEDLTQLHCICLWETDLNVKLIYSDVNPITTFGWAPKDGWLYEGSLKKGIKQLQDYKGFKVAHNQISYDLQAVLKLHDINMLGDNLIDTFIFSKLLFPENRRSSIEFWAEELHLKQSKVKNDDWSKLTLNMLLRCCSDVEINKEVYDHLLRHAKVNGGSETWSQPLQDEQQLCKVHAKQEHTGVKFDVFKARGLVKTFTGKIDVLESEIISGAPLVQVIPWRGPLATREPPTVSKPFLKNRQLKKSVLNYFDGQPHVNVKGPYTKVSWRQINLNSPKEVKEWLLDEGWKPTEYTPTGSPKITKELVGLEGSIIGQKYKELSMIKHRSRYLLSYDKSGKPKGAVTKVRRRDCRVPAQAITLGTPTFRYRHTGAVCNIPRPGSPYGMEIRSLFTVDSGWCMVGVDLSGIEARMMAHYCYDYVGGEDLAKSVIEGNFHSNNAKLIKKDRNTAKTFFYALTSQRI